MSLLTMSSGRCTLAYLPPTAHLLSPTSHLPPTQALKLMAVAEIDDRRLTQLMNEIDEAGDGTISLAEFTRWMVKTYRSYLERPSLAPDRVNKLIDEVYNPAEYNAWVTPKDELDNYS